jgi:hypothetical protein
MDTLINATVVPMADAIGWAASNGVLLGVFGIAWLAFGAALVFSQGSLDQAWQWLTGLPIILQAIVWLLFLPVTLGLWVWEQSWPLIVRLVVVLGLAGFNILVFLPKAAPKA